MDISALLQQLEKKQWEIVPDRLPPNEDRTLLIYDQLDLHRRGYKWCCHISHPWGTLFCKQCGAKLGIRQGEVSLLYLSREEREAAIIRYAKNRWYMKIAEMIANEDVAEEPDFFRELAETVM